MTDGQRQMLREIRGGTLTTVPTTGKHLRCWRSIEGRWAAVDNLGLPYLTLAGGQALDRSAAAVSRRRA